MPTTPIDISGRGDTYSQYPIDVAKTRPRYWYEPDENGYTASSPDLADPNLSGQYNDWNPYVADPSRGYQAQPVVPTATTPTPTPTPTVDPGPGGGAPPGPAAPRGPAPTNGFPDLRFNFTDPGGLTGADAVGAIPLPQFHAPNYRQSEAFKLPTWQSVKDADPGIDFRLNQGSQALQQSAAARGVLNGGGTLKDIEGYGQQLASNEYSNAAQRAWQVYNTNQKTQYDDPNNWDFASAVTGFQPEMTRYSGMINAAAQQPQINWQNAFNLAKQNWEVDRDNQLDKFDRGYKFADLGLRANL